jgi:uncharacterized protein
MAYMHGIRIKENPTSIPTPVTNEAGVPVIFGTAPVNMVSDPEGAVNKLFLCSSFAEAKAAVGYSDDYEAYTLCQAMDAFFKAFGVGPVVLCNVLDPAVHKASYSETLNVVDGQAVSTKKGIVLSGLTVGTLTEGTDYTAEFNDEGYVVFTVLKSGVNSIEVSGSMIDASKVTEANIIGSYDAQTGVETGVELVRKVYPTFSLTPSLLLAPGWSHKPSVGLALAEKCTDVNGMFKCECVVDIDTDRAAKYTDAGTIKTESGFASEHMICVWPKVKYAGKTMYYSAIYAAMATYTDYNNDSVPNLSPSNRAIKVSAAVVEDGTEVSLDINQANELNAVGIVTALNLNGFKAWGNNTAAYPDTTDPKDRWIACRRFFSWWGNSFITTYLTKVDNPANYRLIESIVDSENVRGNSLVSQGKCAGIKMVYSKDDNPIGNVLDGKIVFRQYLAPYTPAEDILNVLEFDPDMIESALGGE